MQTIKGKVIFYNKKSKFGFIKSNDDHQNYYVHEKNLSEAVEPDDDVEFILKDAKRGKEAVDVKKIHL